MPNDDPLNALLDVARAHQRYDWERQAREKQREPAGDWRVWLILAGRGFGKTRTGAEWTRRQIETARCGRMALVGRTAGDVRDVMIEGESGILACAPSWNRPRYEPSKRRLTWPNGAIATTYSADEPDALRGPQHDGFWADEPGAWRYEDTWDQLMFGLRLGDNPRGIATTTPRPTKLIKMLLALSTTHVTRGNSYENRENLPPAFFDAIIKKYEGTRLGRQEINAELLEDVEGALWKRSLIDDLRVTDVPEMKRIVVALDPPATSGEDSAEAGIIVAGLGEDDHGYVLADRSLQGSPNEWAQAVVSAFHVYKADRVIGEVNNGGEMIESVLRNIDRRLPYTAVRATRGKQLRAEPVAALYEQGRVHHVGTFPVLEDQMTSWCPGMTSPDRLDALVWALTELIVGDGALTPAEHIADLKRRSTLVRARTLPPTQDNPITADMLRPEKKKAWWE